MTDIRAAVVQWAESQQGKPYKWGGSGPNGFDCSGLVKAAYDNGAHISIPRTSAEQQVLSHRIDASALQPADLCFVGRIATHVTMYVGGNQVVAADHSGTVVRLRAFNPSEYTNYGSFGLAGSVGSGVEDVNLTGIGIPNPLGPISDALHAIEGVFSFLGKVAEKLTDPTWWRRLIIGALGLIIAGLSLAFVKRGLES